MNTLKKNQHYLPQFYLRNFSYNQNLKQIGLYNLRNNVFIQAAKLKSQASKNFFYGYDGKIEDSLSNIEGHNSKVIKAIVNDSRLPDKGSNGFANLLIFTTLTELRNPVQIESAMAMFKEMKKRTLEAHPNTKDDVIPSLTREEAINLSLGNLQEFLPYLMDLECKLLINKTTNPLISSDFPVVKYNQYLEQKKWPFSKIGYATVGLQIFVPLNFKMALVFYDSGIYKIGDRKQRIVSIENVKDVNQLNILQFVNCVETVYFDEKASEEYIQFLHKSAQKYNKAHVPNSELNYIYRDEEEKKRLFEAGFKNFIRVGKSDCEIQLDLESIKLHSRGKSHKLSDRVAQYRKHAEKVMNLRDRGRL